LNGARDENNETLEEQGNKLGSEECDGLVDVFGKGGGGASVGADGLVE
jgi:hypothetical protein